LVAYELNLCNYYEEIAWLPLNVLMDRIDLGKRRANAQATPLAILTHLTYAANSSDKSPKRDVADFLPHRLDLIHPLLADFSHQEITEINYLVDKGCLVSTDRIEWLLLLGRL
jgi:hypothetical protein